MKKLLLVLVLLLTAGALQVQAGNIMGKVKGKPGNVVVWVEGVKGFSVPATKPSFSQRGMVFFPALLVIVAGQTVQMPNDDSVVHNVYSFSPTKKFNLGIYGKGENKEVTFEQPGVVELFCSIHKQMKGKILIVPNPYYARIGSSEMYRITALPAGNYTLKLWSDSGALETRRIVVPAKGDVVVNF
ncbi:MAG: methylamine utilization protein [Acidobacteria bacterium]|nr:methylamine utilization protein [Acidobacteriota bacterium]